MLEGKEEFLERSKHIAQQYEKILSLVAECEKKCAENLGIKESHTFLPDKVIWNYGRREFYILSDITGFIKRLKILTDRIFKLLVLFLSQECNNLDEMTLLTEMWYVTAIRLVHTLPEIFVNAFKKTENNSYPPILKNIADVRNKLIIHTEDYDYLDISRGCLGYDTGIHLAFRKKGNRKHLDDGLILNSQRLQEYLLGILGNPRFR